MKLRELEARFIRREVRTETRLHVKAEALVTKPRGPYEEEDFEPRTGPAEYHHPVTLLDDADGVMFLCPKCFVANGGPVGTHQVLCWRPRVPPEVDPKPGRWEFEGTGLDDLSLVAGSSSILLTSGCAWHGFVQRGKVTV